MNYLYNGVVLPALPERDEDAYPYVLLSTFVNPVVENVKWRYVRYFSTIPCAQRSFGSISLYSSAECSVLEYFFDAEERDTWEDEPKTDASLSADEYISSTHYIIWSNFDMYYSDNEELNGEFAGTLYLTATATDPISLANQTLIEWDGVTDGLESITRNELTYYRVADVAPSVAQLNGGYTVLSDNTVFENPDNTYWLIEDEALWLCKTDEVYVSLFTYATVVADLDPVAWLAGYHAGCRAKEILRKQ